MSEQATILFVDDDESIRHAAQLRLAANGYHVLTACDGDEGVTAARSRRPDAIVMDVRMPRLDGLAALRILRANPSTKSIPVIVLSASPEYQTTALDEGACYYLHKPYTKESLLVAVHAALQNSKLETQKCD